MFLLKGKPAMTSKPTFAAILLLSLLGVFSFAGLMAFSQTTPERQRNYPAPVEGDYTVA